MNKNYVAIDYLRAFITALVLAHHSFIAYAKFAPSGVRAFTAKPYIWGALPVVDSQRWGGFDVLILFNDPFFMPLMFLLAGLFVLPSITRKGRIAYLRDRMLRLGLPIIVTVIFLCPLTYYPSYLLSGADPAVGAYLHQWLALENWPSGPMWFIAVLLALDMVAVLVHKAAPGWIVTLGKLSAGAAQRPAKFFLGLLVASIVSYVTLRVNFGAKQWLTFGPFAVSAARILLYPTYFFAGIGIGAWGIERGLLARDGLLARRWPLWLGATVLAFVLYAFFAVKINALGASPSLAWKAMEGTAFALSCAATSFFFLAVFTRFANRRSRVLDSFSANAYGIYLIHYAFVAWIQFELLGAHLSAIQKGITVFVLTLLLSWGSIACIGLIFPLAGRVLFNKAKPSYASQS